MHTSAMRKNRKGNRGIGNVHHTHAHTREINKRVIHKLNGLESKMRERERKIRFPEACTTTKKEKKKKEVKR